MKVKAIAAGALTLAALGLGISSGEARTFSLSGTFDDGTTFSGTFETNVYGYLDAWDITTKTGTTNGGSTIMGYEYTPGTSYGSCTGAHCIGFGNQTPPYYQDLNLEFSAPLSAGLNTIVGGPYPDGPSWEAINFGSSAPDDFRYVTSGSAFGTPEPSTWAMMGLGFAGLAFAGYRVRRTAAAIV